MEIKAANSGVIAQAADLLRAGKLVALPTETVYGLGADATNDMAVAAIFAAKGRPQFNPLIVHCASLQHVERYVEFTPDAQKLARHFWPGALTLVLPRKSDTPLSLLVSAGLETVAVRVPSAEVAHAIFEAADIPIAAPSANRSGTISPTTAAHVAQSLGENVELIVDDGPCDLGLESTIIGFEDGAPVLMRAGALAAEDIEAVLGKALARTVHATDSAPLSPGQLLSHYAPNAKIRLDAKSVQAGEALLSFGPDALPTQGAAINLSESGDLQQAAARLFSALHELDALGVETIAVMPIPHTGLGEAINDRLKRAAAPRP